MGFVNAPYMFLLPRRFCTDFKGTTPSSLLTAMTFAMRVRNAIFYISLSIVRALRSSASDHVLLFGIH